MRIVKVRALKYALITGFLFSLHLALVSYANSTFISDLFGPESVGLIFSLAAFLSLLALLFWAPRKIARQGSLVFVGLLLIVSIFTLTEISNATASILSAILFIIYLSHNSIILYGMDIIVEHTTKNSETGKIRGIYLTVLNTAWMIALLGTGSIIEKGGFKALYLIASVLVFLSLYSLYRGGISLNTERMVPVKLISSFKKIFRSKNYSSIYLVSFTLQSFYALMVIFMPLYLINTIGFGWKEVSVIFFVMLSPFVMLEYPLGRIADMRFGEKEILIFGLLVMGLSTLMVANISTASIWIWAVTLFATRIGAATVEVMSDSYFFKHVGERDTGLVGLYRAISPFSYFIIPLIATLIIGSFGFVTLFSCLAIFILLAIIPATRIKDTL